MNTVLRSKRPKPWRMIALGVFVLIGLTAAAAMGLTITDLVPRESGARTGRAFLGAALSPALEHTSWVPDDAPSFLNSILQATKRTLLIAFAALGLALTAALPLALLASERTWSGSASSLAKILPRATRLLITLLRSVHEYLLALLFLAALGLSPGAGVLALALPATGILAKVFAELLDEVEPGQFLALEGLGASRPSAVLFGTLPRALPDLAAYTFYRLECALRGSFILGFFGFPTLGLGLRLAFEEGDYPTVWTHLYALIILMVVFELSSAAMRRRLKA